MAGGHRPTITDVTDPVKLERALRLLFDNVDETRELIRRLGSRPPTDPVQGGGGSGSGGPPPERSGGRPPRGVGIGFAQSTESLQSLTGQLNEPQIARIPRLGPTEYSFEDDPTARGYAVLSGLGPPKTGYAGELRIDEDEQISTLGSVAVWPDYNAKTWRFDDRDNLWKPLQALGCILRGDPASFPAANYARGTLLYHYAQGTFYYCDYDPNVSPQTTHIWVYLSGVYRNTLANKPTGLDSTHIGRLFYATDYKHTWRWNGSAWEFAPGDNGSGYIGWFVQAPNGGAWELCAGSPVTISKNDATTANVTPPNFGYSGSFTDQYGNPQTVYGIYPLGSTYYTGTTDGPYYAIDDAAAYVSGPLVEAAKEPIYPLFVNLIGYIRT